MDDSAAGLLVIAILVVGWIGAMVSWVFSAYYMVKTMMRFHPDRQWGKFVPISIFLPWFFTEEGNYYRAKLVKFGALFLLLVALTASVAFGLDHYIPR